MNDFAFKTLVLLGDKKTKKYFSRLIHYFTDFNIEESDLYMNELGGKSYESIANRVDILWVAKNKKRKLNIDRKAHV